MTDFGGSQTNFRALFDNARPELEIMRPDYDITHTLNANWVWELPVGEGRRWMNNRSLLSSIVGEWGLSGFLRIRSGEVINIVSGRGTINRGTRAAVNTVHLDGIGVGELQNRTGVYRHPDGRVTLFDASLLTDGGGNLDIFRNPGLLEAGTLPMSPISGPWYATVDIGLRKNIALPFSAGSRMQIRVDAFNVFNRVNFNIGHDQNPNSREFGLINSTFAARQIQVGMRLSF